MSGLLLEFNKSDAEEVLKDQGIFTVSYEIELDSGDPGIWHDEAMANVDLGELVPSEDIWEKASGIMSDMKSDSVYDFIGATSNDIGSAFVEWIEDLDSGTAHSMLIKTANNLELLDHKWDDEWVAELAEDTYEYALSALLRFEPAAVRAFAVIAMTDPHLKDFLEDKLEMEIPHVTRQGLWGDKDNLEAIGGMLINKIGKDKARTLFRNLMEDSWDEKKSRSHGINYLDFVKEFINQSGDLNPDTADYDEEEQEEKENIAQFHDSIMSEEGFPGIMRAAAERITGMAEKADYAYHFSNYSMDTFSLPDDVESDFEEWLEEKWTEWRDQTERELVEEISYDLESYFDKSDYIELMYDSEYNEYDIENKVASTFPNFYSKWGRDLDFVKDASLENGFEMFPSTYIESLEESFEFLRDFYSDYNNQSDFEFGDNTGLHTNIGIINGNQDDWNYFKGFLFLNDNFATRGFEDRQYNQWSGSIRRAIMSKVRARSNFDNKSDLRSAALAAVEANFPAIESAMNSVLKGTSSKSFGFSIRDGRIEFRYPGGEVDLDDLEAATMYYAYVVKLITDPNFKRKEYLKRAVSFVFGMADELEKADYGSFAISGDKELSMPKALKALKIAVDNNPSPEAMFYVKAGESVAGIRSGNILKLISPEKTGITTDDPSLYDMEGNHNYERFFSIKNINTDAKTVTVEVYTLQKGNPIASVAGKTTWAGPTYIHELYISHGSDNISLYAVAAALLEGKIQPASTEDYTKIKLFTDQGRARDRLTQIWPWMGNMLKAREITMQSHGDYPRLSREDAQKVGMGDFSPLNQEEAA